MASSPSTVCEEPSVISDLNSSSLNPDRLRHDIFNIMDQDQLEVMLKKRAVLLEEYLRNGGMEPRAVEDRIDILNARIEALEAELAQKGE